MAAYQLKLLQPKELPESGLTTSQFKPWVNHLRNFLQQDYENARFMKGGEYETWTAAIEREDGKRIIDVHENDEEKAAITAENDAAKKISMKKKLLIKRNSQLAKMIQHIVGFVYYAVANDIDTDSTSLEWVFKYLRAYYNIEARGSNFLKLTEHVYKSGMLPQVFYRQFRTSFIDNLRMKGEIATHKGGKVLADNEILSPSFEDAIVLWSLEKIDPRLPKKVRKDYEHRLTGNIYLIDLQVSIFQSIPSMLEDLDKQAEVNALTTINQNGPSLSALRTSHAGRGGRGGRGRGTGGRPFSKRFCRVCHSAGKPKNVFESHNTADCGFFNKTDRKDLYASLKAMNLEEEDDHDDSAWTVEQEDLEDEPAPDEE